MIPLPTHEDAPSGHPVTLPGEAREACSQTPVQRAGRCDDWCERCQKWIATDLSLHECPRVPKRVPSPGPAPTQVSKTSGARIDTSGARQSLTGSQEERQRPVKPPIAGSNPAPSATLAVREPPALPAIERVKALLAECVSVDEVKDIRDQAVAFAAYWRQREDSLEIQNQAAEIRLRAERRLGEMLRTAPKNVGGRPSETGNAGDRFPTLREQGVTKAQSSVWQRIAALADDEFEDRIATARENELELTTSRVLRGPPPEVKARAAFLVDAAEARQQSKAAAPADLKTLARTLLAEHTRAELERFCTWLTNGAAKDEREDAA